MRIGPKVVNDVLLAVEGDEKAEYLSVDPVLGPLADLFTCSALIGRGELNLRLLRVGCQLVLQLLV